MKPELRVIRTPTCYAMDYTGTPEQQEIIRLFGTATIPCPFTAQADPGHVVEHVQARNPCYNVVIVS